MRIALRERPYDLVVVLTIGLILLLSVSIGPLGVARQVVAVASVLFVPGYTIVAALFPRDGDLDWIERIALSFGLSIAAVALLGVVLNYTPFGVRVETIVGALLGFTLAISVIAYVRRVRVSPEERLGFELDVAVPRMGELNGFDKAVTGTLAAVILVGVVALAFVLSVPQAKLGFTEFFLLNANGQPANYPSRLKVSENATVTLVVVNHENVGVNYTARVDLVGLAIVYNTTSGRNETIEANRTTWSWFNASLADGDNWTRRYSFSIRSAGLWKVQFLLFRDRNLASVYRHLELRIKVG
jgi:uncharacterized membrane protein